MFSHALEFLQFSKRNMSSISHLLPDAKTFSKGTNSRTVKVRASCSKTRPSELYTLYTIFFFYKVTSVWIIDNFSLLLVQLSVRRKQSDSRNSHTWNNFEITRLMKNCLMQKGERQNMACQFFVCDISMFLNWTIYFFRHSLRILNSK